MAKRATTKLANDDGTQMVVYNEGFTRNFVMTRYVTGVPIEGSGITVMTGEVDFGHKKNEGLWLGYAKLDVEHNKFVFTKVRELKRAVTDNNNSKSA